MSAGRYDARAAIAALHQRLDDCMLSDRRRLQRALERMNGRPRPPAQSELERLESEITTSMDRLNARRASLPVIGFDDSLPVHARRAALAETIARSQVTIVSGATGSGKSTQLPKICLELGRGVAGMIGHTQPRRIAAQALANRISAETGTVCGDLVGYQFRFVDRTSPRTLVKLMTDGLLLRELETDPLLERYDTLIVDEAHERNLNVDFLLGVCRRLIGQRPELRVIVTSATIETSRFAEFFDGAAVIDVEGRSYPIELRYRPLGDSDGETQSLSDGIRSALDELAAQAPVPKGDALVFLPGERQIMDVRDQLQRGGGLSWEVVPLFARLSAKAQERIFAPHSARRAILATNVAETSLTIPGIRFVVDSGLARVSRYSPRSKFQRLPIERVSRASADQRMGRCGRERDGICIRLYSEDDYDGRPQYTDPEILRTNLASLILRMVALGLGMPEDFPFLDPPDRRLLNDGYRLLQELGAVDGERRITRLGRHMAGLPVDPRLARIMVEAGRVGCLDEATVIAAYLSIRDPRDRPAEKAEAADEKHASFADERSDFLSILNLWKAGQAHSATGRREFRKWCAEHFLSYVRMREWQDLQQQLTDIARHLRKKGKRKPGGAVPAATSASERQSSAVLHQAILTGFLGGIGVLDEDKTYLGARDIRFVIAPGTPLQRRRPRWVVAASLVETQRVYARTVAQVQPSWIESAAAHLVRRTYEGAEWIPERGMAMVRETVSLYGRVLSGGRRVNFASVDAAACRRLFVEEALVARRSNLRFGFLDRNAARRKQIGQIESRLRRRDLLAMDSALVDFYLERVPGGATSSREFERWWRAESAKRPTWLDAPDSVLLAREIPSYAPADYPESMEVGRNRLPLHYCFDPTRADDGITLDLPLLLLRELDPDRLSWLVPGWLEEKVIALMRSLPKGVRRELVPIPAAAHRFARGIEPPPHGSLFEALAAFIARETGEPYPAADLVRTPIPAHLQINLRIRDGDGRLLATGRDLHALRQRLRSSEALQPAHAGDPAWHRQGLRNWDFGEIPESIAVRERGIELNAYPGLEDAGRSVNLRLFPSAGLARRETRRGLVRLAALALPQQWAMVRQACATDKQLNLLLSLSGDGSRIFADIADRAIADAVFEDPGNLPRTEAQFSACIERGRSDVVRTGEQVAQTVRATLLALKDVRARLDAPALAEYPEGRQSVAAQLERLLSPGWVRQVPAPWFERLPKYVLAASRRLERMGGDRERDRRLDSEVAGFQRALQELEAAPAVEVPTPEQDRLRWMIEEFRISLFAQDLRTITPVSAKRLGEVLAAARSESAKR